MGKAFFVFPHQLFEENLKRQKDELIFLIEEPLFFTQYSFHRQKLILHRASMKYYEALLIKNGFKVFYFEALELNKNEKLLKEFLQKKNVQEINYYDVVDDWLEQKIRNNYGKGIRCSNLQTPMFLSQKKFLDEEFLGKKHFSMASFYSRQRKRLGILVDEQGQPAGGKWSFDTDNRRKMPKEVIPSSPMRLPDNEFVKEAKEYIEIHFPKNPGSTNFKYAITHSEARKYLEDFLENRFLQFGAYEDAITVQYTHLFHSVLSPYLNTGLLTPSEVVAAVLEFSSSNTIPLNSLEGFIRQVIGWREFMRAIYVYKGRRERTFNFWDHTRKLPYSFWTAKTGIDPVDIVIRRVLENAYSHHIERLMVMGNFMLLAEIDPDETYHWFMEMYIDAYDWVMVSNVYSMSQYAGGGTSTTKPYLSSSNYILKMSNIKRGTWCDTWDSLYWRFIEKYREFFEGNPRLSAMTIHLKRMDKKKLEGHIKFANDFLKNLN